MAKPGIKILEECVGSGPPLEAGNRVLIRYDIHLNRGDCIMQDAESMVTIGDREYIAGLRYGLEGMRAGGTRRFRASPHLCYRDLDIPNIPKNAVLVFTIKSLQLAQP
jgi:FKBP-type peptidyl-prolyl cis-trans isomerase